MAAGIWTPVAGSTQSVVFPARLNNFSAKLQTLALVAGAHMRFTNLGCLPVFIHSSAPADDAAGFTGVPIHESQDVVLPRSANIWIYSPYENITVHVDVGTLT